MHTYYSVDGEFAPAELVSMCHQAGIRTMSISDHNCVKANEEAITCAERLNIRYIPAVEIDCVYRDVELHLLGYQINYKSPDFDVVEKNLREQCSRYSAEIHALTEQMGFKIGKEELVAARGDAYWKELWTGETIAQILLGKPEYLDNEILRPYRLGGARSDNPRVNFYWDYYAPGKTCYAELRYPDFKHVLELIKDNGGKAVIAHPNVNFRNFPEVFEDILGLGVDGVEAFCSYHDRESAEHYSREARKQGLVVTIGSDFHGKTKPNVRLGEDWGMSETESRELSAYIEDVM